MTIILKNQYTLLYKEFTFKCCIGKYGSTKKKVEGDKKTPKGLYSLGSLFYRSDKVDRPETLLNCIKIKKSMGWCNDIKNKVKYNKLVKINNKTQYDYKYDYFIPIKYNWNKPKIRKGSAIFIHLTKNYIPTAGCIALSKKDFLILVKLIKKNTKIKIY